MTTITNYTHYNTDDLKALVAKVDAYLAANPDQAPGHGDKVSFYESNPSIVMVTQRRWSNATHAYVSRKVRKWAGPGNWDQPGRINLLAPGKLYDNMLEDLAGNMTDVRCAPAEMVQAILNEFVPPMNLWDNLPPLPADGMRLRIEAKVGEKVPVSVRDRARVQKADKNMRAARYEMRTASRALQKASKNLELAKKFGTSVPTEIGDLLDMILHLRASLDPADRGSALKIHMAFEAALQAGDNGGVE